MYSPIISIIFVYILILFVSVSSSLSLYSPDDPLHELDSSNFESVVFQKSNAWIIEFYNNWCGHCIRFAPTWKEFARDIQTWKNVIDVAVVNCADSQNVKLCRDYDVEGFPTIKLFKPFVNESDKGELLSNGDRDVETMGSAVVTYLKSHQNQNTPDWPDLHPLELESVQSVKKLLKAKEGSLILFVEHSDSSIGKKVIMDLSFQTTVVVRRVLVTNVDLLNDLKTKVENSSLATVLKIHKNGNEELLYRYGSGANSTYIRDQIFLSVVGSSRSESYQVLNSKSNSNIKVSVRDAVHMTDLENALRYMLYQEIGVISHIYGDRLLALKSFLLVLKNFFPGKISTMGYISKVSDSVSDQKNVTGEGFVKQLDKLQTKDEYLPEMQDFVSCKGSNPRYRGYPCSLWTLFHTLTVQAYITDVETAGGLKEDVMTVLPNIKNCIRYFFTCEECVENFFKLDQNIDRDSSTSAHVVLWLWSAHNRVNHRLSGDITEDPLHPKIQFPSPNMCPNCRLENKESDAIKWDEVHVLRFLRHFYGKQNIVISNLQGSNLMHTNSHASGDSSMVISVKNVTFYEKWSFQWFTSTDISLCVSLYLVSALLLIVIFLLFRQRRRRKKSQIFKYMNLYP